MPTSPYPDLPLDICGEIFTAVGRELRAITALEPVVGNRIRECESILTAIDDQAGTIDIPAILVAPGPQVQVRIANGNYAKLTTAVEICVLTRCTDPFDTQDWLRQRIFHQILIRLAREEGTLRSGDGVEPDEGDNRITNAMTGFGQIDPTGRLKKGNNIFATTFRAAFTSDIDEKTRLFIG